MDLKINNLQEEGVQKNQETWAHYSNAISQIHLRVKSLTQHCAEIEKSKEKFLKKAKKDMKAKIKEIIDKKNQEIVEIQKIKNTTESNQIHQLKQDLTGKILENE